MPLLLALLAGNYGEHAHRQARLADATTSGAIVVTAETSAAGHTTLGIAEPAASGTDLTFATLGQWNYHPTGGEPCPPAIMAYQGQDCAVTGFMYPLAQGDRVQVFCLLRSTQTCCFGPRPQYNQYLFVETQEPVTFERLRPVRVSGRFLVDPQPQQGYIYRLEKAAVVPAGEAGAPVDPHRYAADHGMPLWDWGILASVAGPDRRPGPLPPALLALDGKRVVVDGYVVQREAGPPVQMVVGLHPPKGSPQGADPTMFDAVTVKPADGIPLPPLWESRMAWQGTLTVAREPGTWGDQGIVQLAQAVPCRNQSAGIQVDGGPLLPWELAGVLVGVFLVSTLGRRPAAPPAP